jgi:hypothetical protein
MFISSSGNEESAAAAPPTVDIEQRMTAIERSLDSIQWLLIVMTVVLVMVTFAVIITIINSSCYRKKAKNGPNSQLLRSGVLFWRKN